MLLTPLLSLRLSDYHEAIAGVFPPANAALLISFVSAVVSIGSAFIAVKQFSLASRVQQNQFLTDIFLKLRTDEKVAAAFYEIDYGRFIYQAHHGSDREADYDRLFTLLDLAAALHTQKVLTSKQMSLFDYQILKVTQNPEVKKYFHVLDMVYSGQGLKKSAFGYLRDYAKFILPGPR